MEDVSQSIPSSIKHKMSSHRGGTACARTHFGGGGLTVVSMTIEEILSTGCEDLFSVEWLELPCLLAWRARLRALICRGASKIMLCFT